MLKPIALDKAERSQRRTAARTFLLSDHPESRRFHQMMDEGLFEDLAAEGETQLIVQIEKDINLPDLQTWKNFQ